MTKFAKLQKRIEAAVARARALGMELVADSFWGTTYDKTAGWIPKPRQYSGNKEVCICGAIALAENPTDGNGILRAIAKKFGITWAQAASLSDGFEAFPEGGTDGEDFPRSYVIDKAWYRIGRKWRARADAVRN